jgi:GNAT superfamily N-acetyltransferase
MQWSPGAARLPDPSLASRVVPLTAHLMPEAVAVYPALVTPWIDASTFLSRSFGFAALVDNRIASLCVAYAIGGGSAEIDIFTAEPFRRRGFARALTLAFTSHCAMGGLVPVWSCRKDNIPSRSLAYSSGFLDHHDYCYAEIRAARGVPE